MESVKVDRSQNVVKLDLEQVEATEKLRFPLRIFRWHAELARHGREVTRGGSGRNHASSLKPVLLDDLLSSGLLRRSVGIVRVDEDVGVEEATSAHGSRRD